VAELSEDGSDFAALLGGFGSHANKQKRAKAERMAALKKGDGRRNRVVTRPHQFNVRVDDETLRLTKALAAKLDASHADLVIMAIAALAKAEKIGAA
jgi:hypothetical protein